MTHQQLVNRLRERIHLKQLRAAQPLGWWDRICKWMSEEPVTLIAPPKPSMKSYVTAYCQKCNDYYDAEFGCRCLQVHPPLTPIQEKVYYVELAGSE